MAMLDGGGGMEEPHAVRWARRTVRHEWEYSRWHWTQDAHLTLCGRIIPIAMITGTFLPETDSEEEMVNCRLCRKRLTLAGARHERPRRVTQRRRADSPRGKERTRCRQ